MAAAAVATSRLSLAAITIRSTPDDLLRRRQCRLGAKTTVGANKKASSRTSRSRRVAIVRAEAEDAATTPAPPPPPSPEDDAGGSGKALAGAGFAVGVGLFALTTLSGAPTLASLEKDAMSLDVALSNGRPTVVEFYADW